MICIDNSEWMRNGDYSPTRFDAQKDAVSLICGAKTQVFLFFPFSSFILSGLFFGYVFVMLTSVSISIRHIYFLLVWRMVLVYSWLGFWRIGLVRLRVCVFLF